MNSGRLVALVVDSDPSMARAHEQVLVRHGWSCVLASGASSAAEALAAKPVDCIVLSLSREPLVRELLAAPPLQGWPRIVGVRFEDDPLAPQPLDAILVKPSPPEALAAACLPPTSELAFGSAEIVQLLEASGLTLGSSESLARSAERIRAALGARAAAIYTDRQLFCAGWDGAEDKAQRHELSVRLLEAAEAQVPMVTGALVSAGEVDGYESAFETCVAASSRGEDNAPRVVVGAVFSPAARGLACPVAPLAALARRFAVERGWQAVHLRLGAELDAVRELGGLDPLLGVWNRSTLDRLMAMMETASRRTGEPLAIAMINIVGLGRINDVYGHREGDAVLRHVAEVAVYVVRGSDVVARYEDDDVAIVFPGATAEQAVRVVERIRSTLASEVVRTDDGSEFCIATSAGVTELCPAPDHGERALARASKAASRGDEASAIMTAFFDPTASDRRPGATHRSLEGITFGGTYRVLHEIGSGGGGGVFRGEDLGLQRPVAIKVLRPELSQNKAFVERFRGEAATLAALRDPHLVQVYAFGLEDGHAYFVMELVEGESLHDAIVRSRREKTSIPIERVRMVLRHISSALTTLHGSGIIHRDVKPANILLDPFRDRSVLVDVGIASRQGERSALAGTPGFMAPEAATSVDVDGSVDVYGLAITLFELLTLQLPWPLYDDADKTLEGQRTKPPRTPSSVDSTLAPLDGPLLRALSVRPADRWRSAREFAAAVDEALSKLDTSEGAVSVPRSSDTTELALAPTLAWSTAADEEPRTRGVVFRALPRVIGPRAAASWRMALGASSPRLADALSPSTLPLGWLPTQLLIELLDSGPPGHERLAELPRDLGKATVRATFRRFFPASAVTLAPSSTLSALPSIWPRYHSWGSLQVIPRGGQALTLRIRGTPPAACLCSLTVGMLEQLVLISGGDAASVAHPSCVTRGDNACRFELAWSWDPASNRSWLAKPPGTTTPRQSNTP